MQYLNINSEIMMVKFFFDILKYPLGFENLIKRNYFNEQHICGLRVKIELVNNVELEKRFQFKEQTRLLYSLKF